MSDLVPEPRLISFSLGPYLLCVNASEVVANIAPPMIARMPMTPAYALGAFIYEDEVAAAIDLRQKFGLAVAANRVAPLIIAEGEGNAFIAVQVDEVFELIDGSALQWRPFQADEADHPFLLECDYQGQALIFSSVQRLFLFRQGMPQRSLQNLPENVVALRSTSKPVAERVIVEDSPAADNVVAFSPAVQPETEPVLAATPDVEAESWPPLVSSVPRFIPDQGAEELRWQWSPLAKASLEQGRYRVSRYWLLATVAVLMITLVLGVWQWQRQETPPEPATMVSVAPAPQVIETPALRIEVHDSAIAARTSSMPAQVVHEVVRGDTLWGIAQQYLGNPYQFPELAQINGIHNPDLIYPGQVVKIYRKPGR